MKRILVFCIAGLVCLCGISAYAEKANMLVDAPPVVNQTTAKYAASLPFGRFPNFIVQGITDNKVCEQWISTYLSSVPTAPARVDTDTKITETQRSAVKAQLKSNRYTPYAYVGHSRNYFSTWSSQGADYKDIEGMNNNKVAERLEILNYAVPEEYRRTANILVTWVVRVEGYTEALELWTTLCHPWHGVTKQEFPAADVKTRLTVNGKQYGEAFSLTIPYGGAVLSSQPHDPTVNGSVLLKPADFNGELPKTMNFKIQWLNESSMKIVSPANQRSLIITLIPVSVGAGAADQGK